MTAQYYQFTEHNNNEGESWNFYVPLSDAEVEQMTTLFECADSEFAEIYEFADVPLTEEQVDLLIKHGNRHSGYMPAHNKCTGHALDLETLMRSDVDYEELDSQLYKGGCWSKK